MKDKEIINHKYYYTTINFDLYNQLRLKLNEYIVLRHLVFLSKRNECENNVIKFARQLCLSRNTVYDILEKLSLENFLKEYKKGNELLYLDLDLKEMFNEETERGVYSRVYHKHKKELKLTDIDYIILFSFYRLSIRYPSIAGFSYFNRMLGIKERNYYRIIKKLSESGLIIHNSNSTSVTKNMKEWFELYNNCSKAA